jgi:hypothetical protein
MLEQPCFAAEILILLGTKLIGQSAYGKHNVVVSQNLIARDIAFQAAASHEAFGKISAR